MKQIFKYQLPNGKIPFEEWFLGLDKSVKARVLVRLERVKVGLYGKYRNLKKGVVELKFETGERIYFYEDKQTIVLLLNGGDKKRQSDDIKLAEKYLDDYIERCKNDKL